MKSERRHELQQNDLAIYLDKINKSVEPYSKIIAIVLAVVIVGGIGIGLYNSQQSAEKSDATLQLLQASATQDAEEMLRVSESYPETAASSWARLYQGKLYLSQGIQALYSDRNNAEQLLEDADAAFRYAISTSKDPLLHSRAHFGIARAAESLGNIDEAVAAYQEVVAVNESDAMVQKAEERIETLSRPQTKVFLAWFGDQDFSPADPSLPPALPGGDQLPDLPDLKLGPLTGGGDEDDSMELRDGGIEMPEKKEGAEGAEPADIEATGETTQGEAGGKDVSDGEPTEETPDDPPADEDSSDK